MPRGRLLYYAMYALVLPATTALLIASVYYVGTGVPSYFDWLLLLRVYLILVTAEAMMYRLWRLTSPSFVRLAGPVRWAFWATLTWSLVYWVVFLFLPVERALLGPLALERTPWEPYIVFPIALTYIVAPGVHHWYRERLASMHAPGRS